MDLEYVCSVCEKGISKDGVFRKSFIWNPRERQRERVFCSLECIKTFQEKTQPLSMAEEKISKTSSGSSFGSGATAF
jgi:hypothetical protein